jgi:hypothetical protein
MKTQTIFYTALAFYAGYFIFKPKKADAPVEPEIVNNRAIYLDVADSGLQPNTNQSNFLQPGNMLQTEPGITGL